MNNSVYSLFVPHTVVDGKAEIIETDGNKQVESVKSEPSCPVESFHYRINPFACMVEDDVDPAIISDDEDTERSEIRPVARWITPMQNNQLDNDKKHYISVNEVV